MRICDLISWPTKRDRFARAVIDRARRRGWPHEIAYDRKNFCLDLGTRGARFFLHNVFKDWSETEAPGVEDLDRIVSCFFESDVDGSLELALPSLLPVVRNRRELESYWLDPNLRAERNDWRGAYEVIGDALAVAVAVDRPASLAIVNSEMLRKWNMSLAPLLERATVNLREKSPVLFERDPGGFYISQYNDQYDCSRLLLPHLFDLLNLNGDPVAVAIARQGLVVAGSRDTSALVAMARFVEEQVEKATRPTSYVPVVRRGDSWVVFEPDVAELEPVRALRAKQILWDYECQRELLQAHCSKSNRDVYAAKIEAMKVDGRIYMVTTWAQTVPTLLPQVDAVAVCLQDGTWFLRSWTDFWTVCGDLLTDEGLYPVRFATPHTIAPDRVQRLVEEFGQPGWFHAIA